MFAGSQFLALGHHFLTDRECKCSLSLVGILCCTDIPQMSYRFYFLVQVANLLNLRLRDDIPNGIFRLGIEAIPFQHRERRNSEDGIKRLNSQCICPEAERGSTLEVNVNNTILEGLKCAVLDSNALLAISSSIRSQTKVLYRRSSYYRTLIRKLDNTLTGGIVFVLQVETKIITALHYIAQIHRVPEVSISSLRVTGNPVERDSGQAACALSLLSQTNLDRDRLSRINLEIYLVTLDILE